MSNAKLTDVEQIKSASRNLRGTLSESLDDPLTGAIAEPDTQLSKFHGIYQQDDRDARSERKRRDQLGLVLAQPRPEQASEPVRALHRGAGQPDRDRVLGAHGRAET